jgi:hypothetical protein
MMQGWDHLSLSAMLTQEPGDQSPGFSLHVDDVFSSQNVGEEEPKYIY